MSSVAEPPGVLTVQTVRLISAQQRRSHMTMAGVPRTRRGGSWRRGLRPGQIARGFSVGREGSVGSERSRATAGGQRPPARISLEQHTTHPSGWERLAPGPPSEAVKTQVRRTRLQSGADLGTSVSCAGARRQVALWARPPFLPAEWCSGHQGDDEAGLLLPGSSTFCVDRSALRSPKLHHRHSRT